MIPLPDLLHLEPRLGFDRELVARLMGSAFIGRSFESKIEAAVSSSDLGESPWDPDHFSRDLFLDELVSDLLVVEIDGKTYPSNFEFLARTLSKPPSEIDEIRFRQSIVREIDEQPEVRAKVERLYRDIFDFLTMLRIPGDGARLDFNAFRLEILRKAKELIDQMFEDFGDASSGLRRLHTTAAEIQSSSEYRLLSTLLDYDGYRSSLNIEIRIGSTGRITDLEIRQTTENSSNPFYRSSWKRWRDKVKSVLWHGNQLDESEIVSRTIQAVYEQISPSLVGLVQIMAHLEFYVANLSFARRARATGLQISLPRIERDAQPRYCALFNPLLLDLDRPPVPCDFSMGGGHGVVVITGPNSGGKTRFLQALGIAQLLGQSGLYVPAADADLPLAEGLFASLIEHETAEHSEGRLGRELERVRSMFDSMNPSSIIILDELCSGTNPSEGVELFSLVLRLLDRVKPIAYISTHFLDFTRELAIERPIPGLEFLQAEVVDHEPTYQLVPGIASTSLASVVAQRIGLTFDQLADAIDTRLERTPSQFPATPTKARTG